MKHLREEILPVIGKPANPSSGFVKVYSKSDGIYSLDSSGVETKLNNNPSATNFDAYDSTGGQSIEGTVTLNIDTEKENNGDDFSLSSDEITISNGGVYLVNFKVHAVLSVGTRGHFVSRLDIDTGSGFVADIPSSAVSYVRNTTSSGTATGICIRSLSDGDKIRISLTASTTCTTTQNWSSISIVKLSDG